jgi:hypothetical protein
VAAPAAAEAPAGEGGGGKRRKRAAKKDETALDVPQDELARRWVDYAGSWRAEHHGAASTGAVLMACPPSPHPPRLAPTTDAGAGSGRSRCGSSP